ncbi:hypothetical protein BWR17_03965 [Phaeobacter inhibens]|uniref:hypothetical protein n=1 Tax=Phaeobacter inhibens TaxID=221822 RepID=UPI00097195F4|nr:hypothetical protein [Phaeobacter inhibens]APX15086.1 hypothetical protein BWR17_03965 [Phaeobacter inhibens]
MTLDQLDEIIRSDHGGAWWALFHETTNGYVFLPTGDILTPRAYHEIRRRFGADGPSSALTPEQRQRNKVQAIADRADEGHRYGR